MTKAPKKYYKLKGAETLMPDYLLKGYDKVEAVYTLEEPMEQKKEMTAKDAWIAMANGECVQTSCEIFQISSGRALRYWDGRYWVNTIVLMDGPYSIVPDPSKPVDADDEYRSDWQKVEQADTNGKAMKQFLEKWYVRKDK